MQLKKNPRETPYSEPTNTYDRHEPEPPGAFEMPAEAPVRTSRPRAPEGGDTVSRPVAAPRAESVVDAHSNFDGRYETDHDLRVQGSISGDVICKGLLTVEREATARARIQAHDAHIQGHLEGDIVCTGRLLLVASSTVAGTIRAATLVVEEGASLAGNVETSSAPLPRPAPVPAVASSATADDAEVGEYRTEPAVASAARNGRQAPTFSFVPSDEHRPPGRN